MQLTLKRVTSEDADFRQLVAQLDAALSVINGETDAFYRQYNKIENIGQVIVACTEDGLVVGCGAIKRFDETSAEVKRMYVLPEYRSQKVATQVLEALESWALEMGYTRCVLETGRSMAEAIAFYTKNRYIMIPNYGQYANVETSICFAKDLSLFTKITLQGISQL
jgi:putative acetyltransferase